MVSNTFVEKMQKLHLKKALHTFYGWNFPNKALPSELEAYAIAKGYVTPALKTDCICFKQVLHTLFYGHTFAKEGNAFVEDMQSLVNYLLKNWRNR